MASSVVAEAAPSERLAEAKTGRLEAGAPPALTVVSLVGLLMVGLFQVELEQAPARLVAALTLGLAILIGILILISARQGFWAIGFLLYLVLSLFHLGLYVRIALLDQETVRLNVPISDRVWYTDAAMTRAAVVVMLGLLAYGLGAGLRSWVSHMRAADIGPSETASATRTLAGIADTGAIAVLAGVIGWLYLSFVVVGRTFFLDGYLGFLSATSKQPISICYLLIGVGLTLAALRSNRVLARVAMVAFGLFAILALMVGIRGEVFIPLTSAVAVFARDPHNRTVLDRLRTPGARVIVCLAVIGVLVGISFVQQVRIAGLEAFGRGSVNVEASALNAVDEMGYSIRVVIMSIEWHEDRHEPYRSGDTYYSPPQRAFARLVGVERTDAATDYRLMNVEIANRVGPIGGSMFAEALHNFGRAGVVVILALVGAAAAGGATRRRPVATQVIMAVIGLMALMHVRNSFAPLFVWGSVGLIIAVSGSVVSRLYKRFRE